MSTIDHFWAVIPAGGAGTRLWPLSRSSAPKFLHDLTGGGRTLLQGTLDRLAPLAGDRVVVVTGRPHRDAVSTQLPEVDDAWVLAEPSPRDSMAAIGLAAALLERHDPDAVMGSDEARLVPASTAPGTWGLAGFLLGPDGFDTVPSGTISIAPATPASLLSSDTEPPPGAVKAVADKLESVVQGLGLTKYGETGEEFDPNLHEALMHRQSDEAEDTTVEHVAQSGYRLGDRVVRAAKVTVLGPSA